MKAKDKAKEIYEKFSPLADFWDCRNDVPLDEDNAKECCLILCDEILKEIPMYTGNLNPKWKFWNDVKEEINKL